MPARQPSRSLSLRPPEDQVALSNSTLNTFLGGRQRPWMLNTQPVAPTPRLKTRPAQSKQPEIQQPSQPTSSSVLPSPAPSDDQLSPIGSTLISSPNLKTASPPGAPGMGLQTTPPIPVTLPVTTARFVCVPAVDNPPPQQPADAAPNHEPADPRPPQETVPHTQSPPVSVSFQPQALRTQSLRTQSLPQPLSEPTPPAPMTAPMHVGPAATNPAAAADTTPTLEWTTRRGSSSMNVMQSPTVTSSDQPVAQGPALKRRRTGYAAASSSQPDKMSPEFSSYHRQLDIWANANGEPGASVGDIDYPRILLLKEACKFNDGFFLVLHQLFCIWSLDRSWVYTYLAQPANAVDAGFSTMEQILRSNELLKPSNLQFFSMFPRPLVQLDGEPLGQAGTRQAVSLFLQTSSSRFSILIQAILERGYPYLVEELLGHLHCYSRVLQAVLFTASRRRLGVPDGQLGAAMDYAFLEAQKRYLTPTGGFAPIHPHVLQPSQLEARNSALIQYFKSALNHTCQILQTQSSRQISLASPLQSPIVRSNATVAQPQHSGSHPGTPSLPSNSMSQPRASSHAATAPGALPPSPYVNFTPQQQFVYQQQQPVAASVPQGQSASRQSLVHPPMGQQLQSWPSVVYPSQRLQYRDQNFAMAGGTGEPLSQVQGTQVPPGRMSGASPVTGAPVPPPPGHPPPGAMAMGVSSSQAPVRAVTTSAGATPLLPSGQSVPFAHQAPIGQDMQNRFNLQNIQNMQIQNAQNFIQDVHLRNAQNAQNMHIQNLQVHIQSPQHVRNAQQNIQYMHRFQAGQDTQDVQRHMPAHAAGLDRLLPPKGVQIARHDWPSGPQDRKCVLVSLHQAQARSPRRVVVQRADGDGGGPGERYYQAIKSLPVPPTPIPPVSRLYRLSFVVTPDQCALLAPTSCRGSGPEGHLPVTEHFSGSLRWRLRCCCLSKNEAASISEPSWVTMEPRWPPHISVKLNSQVIDIRRNTHNGKDLPAELTPYIRAGTNELCIAVADGKHHTAGQFVAAVEVVETLSHSAILSHIQKHGFIEPEKTLGIIKSRLSGTAEDDGIALLDKDLSIDLADPFSSVMFNIPARGIACTHMECFDLETWLNTRPAKPPIKCPHGRVACNCPKTNEPSNPDKWKCPICFKDARPYSLRIDGFLLRVRQQLEEQGKLHARSISVSADGTWSATVEDAPDDDNTDEDESKAAVEPSLKAAAPSVPKVQNMEVIELLDDD